MNGGMLSPELMELRQQAFYVWNVHPNETHKAFPEDMPMPEVREWLRLSNTEGADNIDPDEVDDPREARLELLSASGWKEGIDPASDHR